MHEDKKIEIMNIQYNSLTQCTVEFLHWVIQVILKLFCLKFGPYSFNKFLYYNQKDLWLAPFLQVKVSVVNSAGGSFCWNYATDTFYSKYAGANILQLCRFLCSIVVMLVVTVLVDFFVAGGDYFFCNYAVRGFCIYASENFCNK